MVVLLPLLDGESTRTCARCGLIGLCSPVRMRSNFYPNKRLGDAAAMRYMVWCSVCARASSKASKCGKAQPPRRVPRRDKSWAPQLAKAHAATRRKGAARRRQREVERAEEQARRDAAKQQQRRECMARATSDELAEVDRHCDLEQQGVPLTMHILRTGQSGIRYPAQPFQRWLNARLEELRRDGVPDPVAAYARSLGCSQKRLTDWRSAETVDESSVDRAVTRDGRYTLHDVYPASNVAYAAAMFWGAQAEPQGEPRSELVTVDACARPGCSEERNGGRFCHGHQEELDRIKDEFEADGALMTANGGARRSVCKKKRSNAPVCCSPNCWNPRVSGERFCEACQAEGWIEDEVEIRQLEVLA